jgi:acyl-CoA thioester hydrolase
VSAADRQGHAMTIALEPGRRLVVKRSTVRPEWIDYNGHMNVAYYVLAFDQALDDFFDWLGLDAAYRARTGYTTFALESHVVYRREVTAGDPLRFEIQLLDLDDRFFHYINFMVHDHDGFVAATSEWIAASAQTATRRLAPFEPAMKARFQAVMDAHRAMPRPPEVGRVMSLRKKKAA